MMARIDRWVIQRAIVAIAQRQRAGKSTRLFVKITVDSLQDPQLALWIATNLKQADVPAENLVLSIPESTAFTNLKAVQELRTALAKFGCRLCLEQFGMGLNSFQLLTHVESDYLMIDRNLIEDLGKNSESQQKVREITQRADGLGLKTIAEGVQDAGTMTVLFTSGVNYVMGHFLAPPDLAMNFDFNQ